MNAPLNRYEMKSRIATGGMGEVWRARDTVLGREVAVKVLKPEYAGDATFRTRFETEARHAASLHHPNIATVFDFGEEAAEDGGPPRPYLVMELVSGKPLSDLIQRGRPMAPERVRDLVAQAAAGLAQAHAVGIVHRDIKPANVLVTPDGQVKITDFGIARAADGVALTSTGEVIGTPHYLSPEQAEGRPATPASDVYALGVLLFECLTGSRPFAGDTPVTTALAHVRDPMPDLPADIPEDLARATRRALSKDPAERYPDAAALGAALGRQATTEATQVLPPPTAVLAASGVPVAEPVSEPVSEPTPEPARRRPAGWLLALLGVLALAVLLAVVLSQRSTPTPSGPTGPPSPKTPSSSAPPTKGTPTASTKPVSKAQIVPGDYEGLSTQAAEAELTRLGFTDVHTAPRANPGDQTPDTVARISPTGTLAKDTPITLDVWGDADSLTESPRYEPAHDHDQLPEPGIQQQPRGPDGKRTRSRTQTCQAAQGEEGEVTDADRVGGRYELAEMLGRGGMAEVRKGTDVRLGRTVAVKRLRTDLASDPTFQARFRREAQSAASLNHPSIVSVYDTGEEMSSDGTDIAQPYIVMEYVAGRTLRDIVREGRKILPERALEITSGVLSALDYSHRAGIIHRDIKPGNVMLTPAGDVKVMDFGIARAMSDAHSTMTQTAAVVGTAQYLSPEQARGETVDSRSDVYSTGCLLYELLTGRPPFVGDSPVAVAYQHVREPAPPPSTLDDEIPPEVDAIVMKALAKPLTERYQSAAEMKSDIDRYLAGQPVHASIPVAAAAAAATSYLPAQGGGSTASVADDEYDEPRRRWPLVLLALLLLAILAAAVVVGPKLLNPGPASAMVPALTGKNQIQAERALSEVKLVLGDVSETASGTVKKGDVVSSKPKAGSAVNQGSKVDLVISLGKPAVALPNVIGSTKQDARDMLEKLGLKVQLQKQDSGQPADQVIGTNPPAGERVPAGSTVKVYFSAGPQQVPDVTGKTEAEARKLITDAGFQPSVVHDSTTKAKKGNVIEQSPKPGTPETKGSQVTIVVSTYEKPTTTPTPTETPTTTPTPTETPTGSPTDTPTGTPTP